MFCQRTIVRLIYRRHDNDKKGLLMPDYRTIDIEVDGGLLHVGLWGNTGPRILCSHGITANHLSFQGLADALGDGFQLIAPDHRGRGGSAGIAGPWGMAEHARDMAALLDALNIDSVDLMLGHSMGAFVTVVSQAAMPERIPRYMLVDGGLPLFDEVPDVTPEQLIDAIIGPAMQRLDMQFESAAAYLDFWRAHPAFARVEDWSDALENYFLFDLTGKAPHLHSPVNKTAIVEDTNSQLMSDVIPASIEQLSGEGWFLQAPRGVMDDAPLYPLARVERLAQAIPGLTVCALEDVNHYTIVLGGNGARQIATLLRRTLKPGS